MRTLGQASGARPWRARVVGASSAVLITVLFLRVLDVPPPPADVRWPGEPVTTFLPRLQPLPSPPPPAGPAARRVARKFMPAAQPLAVGPVARPAPAAASSAPAAGEVPPPPPDTVPAPLVIDTQTLRSAARSSASPVRSMAGVAGVDLASPARSIGQAQADSIARSGKSDCLASNENGSLLSVFVIAYEAATGRCR